MEHQKKLIRIKKDKRKKASETLADSMKGIELVIPAQVGEEGKLFGSITSMDVAKHLADKGFTVDKRKILLDTPIKQEGEFNIAIKLDEGLNTTVKVTVVKG